MKPWSVREEANSTFLWQAVTEHSLLPHLTHAFAGDVVQGMPVRGEHLAEVQHLVPSARCVTGRGKKM